jgi:MFS family permease
MKHAQITTNIPARLDRLPWSRFHWLVIVALGITWILDGLEVTIVGSIGPVLKDHRTLSLTDQNIGAVASIYVAGAVIGALFFGWLTDRYGRKLVFNLTLAIYLIGVICSALSWNFWSFAMFRLVTGLGIGGEYAAINSAIDELIPARLRGRIDLMVNGSYWGGAAMGAGASLLLLSPHYFSIDLGWRLGFGIGAVLGAFILFLRRFVPESPRWQITHGRITEAEATMQAIEKRVGGKLPEAVGTLTLTPRTSFGLGQVMRTMIAPNNRSRSFVVLMLMISQAFLYNAVFFTYGLVLTNYYHLPAGHAGMYVLPLTLGNLFGPFVLGRLFDTVGRKPMITLTYALSGALLLAVAVLFDHGMLSAWTQTFGWMLIFFFASAAASSAYLTASELFPLEVRALAIAIF